jgi:lysosomal acid phosphatase
MFSGHDTNVAPTLWFLNLTTAECLEDKFRNSTKKYLNCEDGPDFAASITFELWNSASPIVKIQYNGKYVNLCERNSTECSYSEWKSRIERQYVDYNKVCNNTKSPVQFESKNLNEDLSELLHAAWEHLPQKIARQKELRVEDI